MGLSAHRRTDTHTKVKHNLRQFHSLHLADTIVKQPDTVPHNMRVYVRIRSSTRSTDCIHTYIHTNLYSAKIVKQSETLA